MNIDIFTITNHEKLNKFLLYLLIFSFIYLSRDSLFSTSILGFYLSQYLLISVFGCIVILFLYNNRNKIKTLVDIRLLFLIIATIFIFFLIIVKKDFSLMYISLLSCFYYACFLSYCYSFKDVGIAFTNIMIFICIYSVLTTYIGKFFPNLNDYIVFENPSGLEFLNYGFSYAVNQSSYLRNFGCFREPGVYLFFLILSIFLNYKFCTNNLLKFLKTMVFVITVFTTFSSVGIVSLFLILIAIFFDLKLYNNKIVKIVLPVFIAILILMIYMIINKPTLIPNDLYWELYAQIMKFTNMNASLAPRLKSIAVNFRLFLDNVLVGNPVESVMYALDHNTSSTMIMFSMTGIVGGLFSVISWLYFILEGKFMNIYKISNIFFMISLFMCFNTQNLITNFYFWGFELIYIFENIKSLNFINNCSLVSKLDLWRNNNE